VKDASPTVLETLAKLERLGVAFVTTVKLKAWKADPVALVAVI
jgi:hypothetical protein